MSRYDRPSHQVYTYFFKRGGSEVQFLEPDLKTPLPRKQTSLTREDPGAGQARGGLRYFRESADARARNGDREGGIYLRLTPTQYARLRRSGA